MVKEIYLDKNEDRMLQLEKLKKTAKLNQLLKMVKQVGTFFNNKEFRDMEKFLENLIEEMNNG